MPAATEKRAAVSASIGLILTAIAAIVFWFTNLDLALQRLAWRPTEPHWPYATRPPWLFLHNYGTWPGMLLARGALVVLSLSFVRESARQWRYPALFVFLFMGLGPGVVTNLFGKMLCGRPRPYEIVQFGGSLRFHRAFEFGHPGEGFSYLCGPCSMGFVCWAWFFLWRGPKRWLALAGGALLGLLLGVGRVAQGAHFPSDVILDGTLMFTVAAAISPIASREPKRLAIARWKVVLISTIVGVLTVVTFLFSTPVHREWQFLWIRPGETRAPATDQDLFVWHDPKQIAFAVQKGDVTIDVRPQHEPLRIDTLVKGFGFPGADDKNTIRELQGGRVLSFTDRLKGAFWEVHGSFGIALADDMDVKVSVRTGDGNIVLHEPGKSRVLGKSVTLSIENHRVIVE